MELGLLSIQKQFVSWSVFWLENFHHLIILVFFFIATLHMCRYVRQTKPRYHFVWRFWSSMEVCHWLAIVFPFIWPWWVRKYWQKRACHCSQNFRLQFIWWHFEYYRSEVRQAWQPYDPIRRFYTVLCVTKCKLKPCNNVEKFPSWPLGCLKIFQGWLGGLFFWNATYWPCHVQEWDFVSLNDLFRGF